MNDLVPSESRIDRPALERIIQRAAELQTKEREIGDGLSDTELMHLAEGGFTCSLAQDAAAGAAGVSWEEVTQIPGTTKKVTLKTWEDDGTTAGSTAALVSWLALGK